MKKIHRIATIVQLFLIIFALFEVGGVIYKHFMLENMHTMMHDPRLFTDLAFINTSLMPLPSRLSMIGIDFIILSVLLAIYFSLFKLTVLYKKGQLFTDETAKRFFSAAKLFTLFAAMMPALNTLSILALTWHNAPGERLLSISVTSYDAKRLFFALLLLAFGYITLEGRKMQETCDLTV